MRRGEIWWASLPEPQGSGPGFRRPVVAVQANSFNESRIQTTVEALKEGWDCSFAYVLCSLQESRSAKDVEQLLGRVLRMPYAKARSQPELNKAYAHVLAASFSEAADQITDKLVNNMGFERYEAAIALDAPVSMPKCSRGLGALCVVEKG